MYVNPLSTGKAGVLFAVRLAATCRHVRWLPGFETWIEVSDSEEYVLAASGAWLGMGISNEELHREFGNPGNIKFVLCVRTSPEGVLGVATYRVDKDLHLVEVYQGIRHVLGWYASIDSGDPLEPTSHGRV